jgi:hypothetical protein
MGREGIGEVVDHTPLLPSSFSYSDQFRTGDVV